MTIYFDNDGDGYGDENDPGTQSCGGGSAPPGYSLTTDDCHDGNNAVNPGADWQTSPYSGGNWDYNCNGQAEKFDDFCWKINSCTTVDICADTTCSPTAAAAVQFDATQQACGTTFSPYLCEFDYYYRDACEIRTDNGDAHPSFYKDFFCTN